MVGRQCIELLGEWEGYRLGTVGRVKDLEHPSDSPERREDEAWIKLLTDPQHSRRCVGCGRSGLPVHDVYEKWIRDLPILGMKTWLVVHRVRVACSECGPKVEELDWLSPYSRVTKRLAESVARLCKVLSVKHVAEYFELGWDTVKAIDKAYLEETLGPVELSGVEQIVMDEFAIQKGHRYATVIVEPRSKRVLWVGRGRKREDTHGKFQNNAA